MIMNHVCQWLKFSLIGLAAAFVGCGAERESLFEGEHELPPHWPTSMADAVQKIEVRLWQLDARADSESADRELRELVRWIPEVAADDGLTEEQWKPIFELCEVVREHLSDSSVKAIAIAPDFKRLQQLLKDAVAVQASAMVPTLVEPHLESSPGDAS